MARLIWSPAFVDDFEEICEYIGRDSQQFASVICEKVINAVEAIPAHPRMSSIVPEYQRDDIREIFVYRYRLIFRLHHDAVQLVTVIHGARLLPSRAEDLPGEHREP